MRWNNRQNHFLEMPMYFRHFSGVTVYRNIECTIQVLPNFPCLSEEVLHFLPTVPMAFMSGLSASIAKLSTTHESVAWPKTISKLRKNATRLPGLSLSWSSYRTILLSLLTARLLVVWSFSQSFAVMQDVWDTNHDSKSFIVVIRCRQENKRGWAEGDNMNNKSWTQTRTCLLKVWMHRSSNTSANRTRQMVRLFLSSTVHALPLWPPTTPWLLPLFRPTILLPPTRHGDAKWAAWLEMASVSRWGYLCDSWLGLEAHSTSLDGTRRELHQAKGPIP